MQKRPVDFGSLYYTRGLSDWDSLPVRELQAVHTNRKSHYKRAWVYTKENSEGQFVYHLRSYDTIVCGYNPSTKTYYFTGDYSKTTKGHIDDFCCQMNDEFSHAVNLVMKNEKLKSYASFLNTIGLLNLADKTYTVDGHTFKYE